MVVHNVLHISRITEYSFYLGGAEFVKRVIRWYEIRVAAAIEFERRPSRCAQQVHRLRVQTSNKTCGHYFVDNIINVV